MGIKGAHAGSSDQIGTIHTRNTLRAWPSSAERVRRCRQRQRAGLRAVRLDVRRNEIETLIMRSCLGQDAAGDVDAIGVALGRWLDQHLR